MRYTISDIQKNKKNLHKNLVVPNNCVNTHTHTHTHTQIITCVYVVLSRKFFRLLSLKQNIVPPTFVGGFWRLSYSKFSFHKYRLKAPLFCLITWSFLLGAFSVQRGSSRFLSVLAFPLVLCVFREGRRFFRLEVRFQSLEFSVASSIHKSNIQPLKSNIQYLTSINFKYQQF